MRQAILVAGLVALANASPAPAPQSINFAAVNAAPPPAATGPPVSVNSQSIPYNSAAVAASGSAAATAAATASATATQAAKVKRNFGWGGWGGWNWWQPPAYTPPAYTPPAYTPPAYTPPAYTPPPYGGPTTTSSQTSTTTTTSSSSSCPTVPEAGTYCGFINPEDDCAPQPDGYGPVPSVDTPAAFLANTIFHTTAQSAAAPAGYAATFRDLNAAVNANTYLGLNTLKTYDPKTCSAFCDSTTLCTAFNIYYERDPSLNPTANCSNPASITNIKCTLWGSGVNAAAATNTGQTRNQFVVVITGSDGFEKTNSTTPAPCPGWQPPQKCGDGSKAHNHPSTCIGTHFFPGPYNPALCGAYALAQNALNVKASWWSKLFSWFGHSYNPGQCSFFNSYMLKKNGVGLGTFCGLYAQHYDGGSASYQPGWQGSDFWNVESSCGWDISY